MAILLNLVKLCNNVSFYRYRVSQEDGSMPCDRPVNVLLYLLFYWNGQLVWTPALGLYTGMDN